MTAPERPPQGAAGRNAHAHALALVMTVIVSTSFPLGKAITHGLDPAVMMCIRFALASALFAPIVAWREGLHAPSGGAILRYLALGAPLAFFFWSMFEALRHTSALNTGALFTTVPGFSALFGALLVGERLGRHRLAALGLGMVGAAWIVFRGEPERLLALEVTIGDGIFLAGCAAFGVYGPLIKRLHRDEPVMVLTFWTLVSATLWLTAASNAALWRTDWSGVTLLTMGGVAYLAVFPTIITFFITQYTTLRLGPTRVVAYSYGIPAVVLLIDLAAGTAAPPATTVPGFAIVLLASVVVQRGAIREFRP